MFMVFAMIPQGVNFSFLLFFKLFEPSDWSITLKPGV
jgi:hypothetical protein